MILWIFKFFYSSCMFFSYKKIEDDIGRWFFALLTTSLKLLNFFQVKYLFIVIPSEKKFIYSTYEFSKDFRFVLERFPQLSNSESKKFDKMINDGCWQITLIR
jgi:hypothetical protein